MIDNRDVWTHASRVAALVCILQGLQSYAYAHEHDRIFLLCHQT